MDTKLYLVISKIYNAALRGIGAIEVGVEIVVMRTAFLTTLNVSTSPE